MPEEQKRGIRNSRLARHYRKGIGLPGIFKFYKNFYKNPSLKITLVSGLVIMCLSIYFNNIGTTLDLVIEYSIAILPSLLGLSLASLAIISAMAVKVVVKKIEERSKEKKRPGFSQVLAIFSFAVFIHAVSLISAVVISFAGLFPYNFGSTFIEAMKAILIAIQSFLLLYSLFIISDMIPAMFTYGRLYVNIITEEQSE